VILAAWRDDTYNVFLFLHIIAFLVAAAPAVLNPMLAAYFRSNGGEPVLRSWSGFTSRYTRMFSLGTLGVLLVTGIVMIVLSDELIEFSDLWISLSFLVWLAIGGVVSALVLKGQKQVAAGDMSGVPKILRGSQITSILLLLALYLMVFKPGA
jgi:uncharacterized membrane protein